MNDMNVFVFGDPERMGELVGSAFHHLDFPFCRIREYQIA